MKIVGKLPLSYMICLIYVSFMNLNESLPARCGAPHISPPVLSAGRELAAACAAVFRGAWLYLLYLFDAASRFALVWHGAGIRAATRYPVRMTVPPKTQLLDFIDVPAMLIERGRVRYANPAARSLLGAHIVGQDLRLAIRIPAVVELVSGADDGRVQAIGLSVAGSVWEISSHVVDAQSRFVTLTDLSIQAGVARAHADFVANASHELRTPLAAILGYVETLETAKAGDDRAVRTRFLGTIGREAQRILAVIEDLMSLSRIEARKHEQPRDAVDMVSLIRRSVREAHGARPPTFESNCSEAIVAGDDGQLAQVMRNLIDNAIKYGRDDGAVHVSVESTEGGWLSITVRDEGDGIAAEHLPRLTERFYRVDAGRSRAAGGTGLGLSIVKHIVERHRGRFDISSREGQGTIVSIILPLATGGDVTKM